MSVFFIQGPTAINCESIQSYMVQVEKGSLPEHLNKTSLTFITDGDVRRALSVTAINNANLLSERVSVEHTSHPMGEIVINNTICKTII